MDRLVALVSIMPALPRPDLLEHGRDLLAAVLAPKPGAEVRHELGAHLAHRARARSQHTLNRRYLGGCQGGYLVSVHLVPPARVAATAWVEVGADQGGAELGRRDVQHQGQLLVSRRPAQRRVLAQRAAHLQQ